jgi:peptidyl-prolyl cis-trans isomerase C
VVRILGKYVFVMVFGAACASASVDDDVVLKTRDFVVTTGDFEGYLTDQGITGVKRNRTLAKEGAVRSVFENIYVIRAFAAQGERNPGIDKSEIERLTVNYRERLLMKKQLEFEVEMALRDLNWDALAKEQYIANKSEYTTEERVSAAHILISSTGRTPEEVQLRIDDVAARLQAGEDFQEMAQEYSDDAGSAVRGGELGFFKRKKMAKPFEDTVFAMTQAGEISVPVETQYGYHIIRFNERKPQRQLSFEKAKASIIRSLKTTVRQDVRQDKVAAMQNGEVDFGLEVNLPLLEAYVQRYSVDAEIDSKQ